MIRWPTNRCYDCTAPIGWDEIICAECRALYKAERDRRARVRASEGNTR